MNVIAKGSIYQFLLKFCSLTGLWFFNTEDYFPVLNSTERKMTETVPGNKEM